MTILFDHRPILFNSALKGNLDPELERYQIQSAVTGKLVNVKEPEKKLAIADLITKNLTKEDNCTHQIEQNCLTSEVAFTTTKSGQK